jgi:isoquinoline 1-oxidoreductase beta subunit
VATVIDVEVQGKDIKVHDAYVVLDCGTHINPDTCVAQMEGAVVFGLSLALKSEITFDKGFAVQGNLDTYELLRMMESPRVTVDLVQSEALPAGVGEPGVPPVAPALTNAIFAASGQRIRKLPVSLA